MTAVVLDQLAYRPNQAARAIGISRSQLDERLRRGEIRYIKLGDHHNAPVLIRREALIAFLDAQEAS